MDEAPKDDDAFKQSDKGSTSVSDSIPTLSSEDSTPPSVSEPTVFSPSVPNSDSSPSEPITDESDTTSPDLSASDTPDISTSNAASSESIEPSRPSTLPASDSSDTEPLPVPPAEAPAPAEPAPAPKKRGAARIVLWIIIVLILLAAASYGAYWYGNNRGYTNGKNAQNMATSAAELKVPASATMIAQCTPGEGTQYVLPSDIPQGPIYNVWKGKVTGIEYMLGVSEIANMKTQNLSLMTQKYNHIDVMYEAAGHAGFTEPHYHVILSMIPYSQEQQITCGSTNSSTSSDSTSM